VPPYMQPGWKIKVINTTRGLRRRRTADRPHMLIGLSQKHTPCV